MKTHLLMIALLWFFMGTSVAVADDKPTSVSDAREAIEANMRTREGKAYDEQMGKEFAQKYLDTMKHCKESAGNDLGSFWMLLKLDKDGVVKEVLLYPATKMGSCARETLLKGTFSAPPRPAYWVGLYMKMSH
jgi:hypothetical protein